MSLCFRLGFMTDGRNELDGKSICPFNSNLVFTLTNLYSSLKSTRALEYPSRGLYIIRSQGFSPGATFPLHHAWYRSIISSAIPHSTNTSFQSRFSTWPHAKSPSALEPSSMRHTTRSPSRAKAIARKGSRSQCSTCRMRGHKLKISHARSSFSSIVVHSGSRNIETPRKISSSGSAASTSTHSPYSRRTHTRARQRARTYLFGAMDVPSVRVRA